MKESHNPVTNRFKLTRGDEEVVVEIAKLGKSLWIVLTRYKGRTTVRTYHTRTLAATSVNSLIQKLANDGFISGNGRNPLSVKKKALVIGLATAGGILAVAGTLAGGSYMLALKNITWFSSPEDAYAGAVKPVRPWVGFTLHCTATPFSSKIRDGNGREAVAIEAMHHTERGWTLGMGYHFLIETDGMIAIGTRWRDQKSGAHEKGFNSTHIGISLSGLHDKGKDTPTPAQMKSLISLVRVLNKKLGWSGDYAKLMRYHHDSRPDKTCPGTRFWDKRAELANAMATNNTNFRV